MKTKLLIGMYAILLGVIVFCADSSQYHHLFAPIKDIPGGDKLGHFILMGLFAGLLNLGLACRRVCVAGRSFLLGSLIVLTLITIEELSQLYVPYRTFDLVDLLADYLGVFVLGRLATMLHKNDELPVV